MLLAFLTLASLAPAFAALAPETGADFLAEATVVEASGGGLLVPPGRETIGHSSDVAV